MAEDWAIDVKKYVPDADDAVIAAIVRHCGIALRSRDASLVSFTDRAELDVVRESWLKKKLGLTNPDAVLDAAIAKVGERMKADHTKNRVTVYYLLAEAFGKLGLLGGAAEPLVAPAVVAAAAVASAPVAAAVVATPHKAADKDDGGWIGTAALTAGAMAAIVIGTAIFAYVIHGPVDRTPAVIPPQTLPIAPSTPPVAAVVAAQQIPQGAGVIAQDVDGKPKVSVYFDTAKTDISPDFATVAAPIKAYVDSHPGTQLGVSGFNDPRGNVAFNAELSKNRAKSVRAALVVIGVPIDVIDLVKPAETTDTADALAEGRRVDIYVKQ